MHKNSGLGGSWTILSPTYAFSTSKPKLWVWHSLASRTKTCMHTHHMFRLGYDYLEFYNVVYHIKVSISVLVLIVESIGQLAIKPRGRQISTQHPSNNCIIQFYLQCGHTAQALPGNYVSWDHKVRLKIRNYI